MFSLTYFKEYGGITCSVLSIDGWLLSVLVSLSACHVLCRWNWCSCADCWTLSRCSNDHLLHQYVWPWSYAGMYCPVRKCCGKSTLDTLSALILVACYFGWHSYSTFLLPENICPESNLWNSFLVRVKFSIYMSCRVGNELRVMNL